MTLQDLLQSVEELLDDHGITANVISFPDGSPADASCRMICITGDLGVSRDEMKASSRDHVVMVRVDDESIESLDAWIRAGVASSRSEAAALFIREGLKLRSQELGELRASLDKVEDAQAELRDRARRILGDDARDEGDAA